MGTLILEAATAAVGYLLGHYIGAMLTLRARHGAKNTGVPLPAFLIRAEQPSAALRAIVAKVARSAAKDAMQEWDSMPPSLKEAIRKEVHSVMRPRVPNARAHQNGASQ